MDLATSNPSSSSISRRTAALALTASVTALVTATSSASSAADTCDLDEPTRIALNRLDNYRPTAAEWQFHELQMTHAIRNAASNPKYPFGTVIVDTGGRLMAEGVNNSSVHPGYHGEVVAINAYIEQYGNTGWANTILYTTGEPCAMCLSMIAWARIPRVVWASSVDTIRNSGIGQIAIGAIELAARAHEIYQPEYLLGGIGAEVMDFAFQTRPR
ncbi:nucleoside deaminase [Nocardia sp. NBC_01499]|uniref:nucleoside deaminase n=1 Tax=Nocardia sp. NBC_01499 TaxID=2903597 RepID=UPI00386FABCA